MAGPATRLDSLRPEPCALTLVVTQGGVAQLVEHLLCKQGVVGSSPIASTI